MGCSGSMEDLTLPPVEFSPDVELEQLLTQFSDKPLKDLLAHQDRKVSAVVLGQDGEKVLVTVLRHIINSLRLPFRLTHVSQEDYSADIQLECLVNDLIVLVEVKNKLTITDTLFDQLDHPKGDVNKFDRDLYLAATKHPTAHIEGLFTSLVAEIPDKFLHKKVTRLANEQLTERSLATWLVDLLRKYPKTYDVWFGSG